MENLHRLLRAAGTAVTFSWVTESDAASTVLLGTQSGTSNRFD